MLVNDPPIPLDPAKPDELNPKVFGGNAMTYYGRWTYKYDKASELGAAAVFIVHETVPAGYGFNVVQGFGGERFDLVTPDGNMSKAAIQGWLSLETRDGAAEGVRTGLRDAEGAGEDARVPAGAARRHGVDVDSSRRGARSTRRTSLARSPAPTRSFATNTSSTWRTGTIWAWAIR